MNALENKLHDFYLEKKEFTDYLTERSIKHELSEYMQQAGIILKNEFDVKKEFVDHSFNTLKKGIKFRNTEIKLEAITSKAEGEMQRYSRK